MNAEFTILVLNQSKNVIFFGDASILFNIYLPEILKVNVVLPKH